MVINFFNENTLMERFKSTCIKCMYSEWLSLSLEPLHHFCLPFFFFFGLLILSHFFAICIYCFYKQKNEKIIKQLILDTYKSEIGSKIYLVQRVDLPVGEGQRRQERLLIKDELGKRRKVGPEEGNKHSLSTWC